jgi:hypothetical protein
VGEFNGTKKEKSQIPDVRWLLAGAVAGLLAAAFGILRQADPRDELPDNALARVNDQIISRENYDRAVARMGAGIRSETDNARVLQRLVDDELLVQRGLELGMAQSDISVRDAIINSLIAYLEDNAIRFSYVARMAVAAWQSDAEEVAQSFVTALRDDGSVTVSDAIGPVPDLPAGLQPVEQLRDYLGPGITAAAADMPTGSSAVFARRGRWMVLQVLEKESSAVTDLSSIRNRVLLDYRRSLAERSLREYLDDLRRRADVVVVQP